MFLFSNKPAHIFKKNQRVIFLSGLFFAMLSLGITMLFPLEYRADAQALVISKSRYGVDPYTVVKSAERVGENIIQVMKTDDFFDKVMTQTRYDFDRDQFKSDSARIVRKRWNRAVIGSVVYGTGIINVSAYGRDATDTSALASAVVDTLVRQGWEYVGGDVTIKEVNHPAATRFPARPNVFLIIFFGFLAGALLMSILVLRRGA